MLQTASSTGGADYTYRADGMRVRKIEGAMVWWNEWDGTSGFWDSLHELNAPTTRYLYDGQTVVEDESASQAMPVFGQPPPPVVVRGSTGSTRRSVGRARPRSVVPSVPRVDWPERCPNPPARRRVSPVST